MKKWKIRFTPESSRLLSKLHPDNKVQVKQALTELRQNPFTGKDLQEELSGFKSLRLKQYRIITISMKKKILSRSTTSVKEETSTNNSGVY